jgi:hypothetical protein
MPSILLWDTTARKKKETKENNGEGKKATAQRSTGEGITRHVHTEGEGI